MKKLKLVGILVAVVLIGGVISISFINNNIAYKVEKELCETPLPEKTELIESISRTGKLTGNGNGMQYFGAILIQSELSLKELDDYYSDHRSNEWEYLVEIQEGQYSNFTFTFSIFIESLGDRDSLFVSIGTFISFFIGEIIEYINDKSNS